MTIKRSHVACGALVLACGLYVGWAGALHAQSLFSSSPPHQQADNLTRSSGPVAATRTNRGTAFFVDNAGDMLTAGHVVAEGCSSVVVAKEGHALAGRVAAVSSRVDLALIKVPKTLGLSAVFPRSVSASANDMLFAADYDKLSAMTAHGGSLANATVAADASKDGYLVIQSDVTFGASGAPVLDSRGLVQGVISRRTGTVHIAAVDAKRKEYIGLEQYVMAVDAAETKAFLAANQVAIEEDDRSQIAASASRANRAASISARVFCTH